MMSTPAPQLATTPIPVQLSEPEFETFLLPHLSMPKRGPKCKLATGCKFCRSSERLERARENVYLGSKYPAGTHKQNGQGSCALHRTRCPSEPRIVLTAPLGVAT